MLQVLIVFEFTSKVNSLIERYDLVCNVTNKPFHSNDSKWINVYIRNDFDPATFSKYKKETSNLNLLEHGNNIYNYYYQVVGNLKKDILALVGNKGANFFVENYFFHPSIYFTGIKEQSSFPMFLLGSCFGQALCDSLKESGFNVQKYGRAKGRFRTLLRNKLLYIAIFLKLLFNQFLLKSKKLNNVLYNYNGNVILVRNIHQYREAKKIQSLVEGEVLLLPSMHPVTAFSQSCYSLSKKDVLYSFFRCLKKSKNDLHSECVSNSINTILLLESNSRQLPNYTLYRLLLEVVDRYISSNSTVISLEQLSPQAIIENNILGRSRPCVGFQTTLIELKEYYLISPFSRFFLSDLAGETFFSKLGYDNVKYKGSVNYTFIKNKVNSGERNKISILTQAYNVDFFKSYLKDVIAILKDNPNYSDKLIQILVHPREDVSDYDYFYGLFDNLEILNSDENLLENISESIFVITRTTSLIQECIYMNIPVFTLLFCESDIELTNKVDYFDVCLKCFNLKNLHQTINSNYVDLFRAKRSAYLSTTKDFVFEKLD